MTLAERIVDGVTAASPKARELGPELLPELAAAAAKYADVMTHTLAGDESMLSQTLQSIGICLRTCDPTGELHSIFQRVANDSIMVSVRDVMHLTIPQ